MPPLYDPFGRPLSPQKPSTRRSRFFAVRRVTHRLGKWLAGAVVAVGTLISYFGLVVLPPDLSITTQTPLDPADPFTALFVVTNTGFSDAYSVRVDCVTRYVKDANGNTFTRAIPTFRGARSKA